MPARRFQDLVEAATAVFITQGYRRTQMADVAEALGVAKGTLYLCVESKEALFDVALRYADAPRPIAAPPTLPVPTPARGRTLRYVQERLASDPASPTLREALGRGRVNASAEELAKIVRELHRGHGSKSDLHQARGPLRGRVSGAGEGLVGTGRGVLLAQLTTYLESGIRLRRFRAVPDPAVAARLVMETLVFWAVHRHWDPAPQPVDPRAVEEMVVQMLVDALAAGTPPAGTHPSARRRRPLT